MASTLERAPSPRGARGGDGSDADGVAGIALRLDGVGKRYGGRAVLSGLSLAVAQGEVVALLGPSGSGKTTALRLVAGFEAPDEGGIWIAGRDVGRVPPEGRRVGMVFQNYALFPHLSVGENVGFGLRAVGLKGEAARARVRETLAMVGLEGLEARRIAELSGGMQQRVAVARALAARPSLLLLDEPLSNLDPGLRERTRRELLRLIRSTSITTLLVTHEQEEAFDLADRIAVLHQGRLEQVADAATLHDRPASRFVAAFIGRCSELPARRQAPVEPVEGAVEARLEIIDGRGARLGGPWTVRLGDAAARAATDLVVLPRPEDLELAPVDPVAPGAGGGLQGTVAAVRFGRPWALARVEVAAGLEVEVAVPFEACAAGDRVAVAPRTGRAPVAFAAVRPGEDAG